MTVIFLNAAVVIFIYVLCWFVLAQLLKDNSIIDIAWGLGFTTVSFFGLFYWKPAFLPAYLLVGMVAIWGIRLGGHIFIRGRGKGEDWRYKKWREEWGKTFLIRTFFQVFMLQGFLMFLISSPIIQTLGMEGGSDGISLLQMVGIGLWLSGFLWEAISDYQLLQFKKDAANKGKIMMEGLWAYSRHPNYFGEIVLWWGIFIFTLPYGYWWLSLVSPLVVNWLLTRVSGVPMLERKYKGNEVYQAYIKRTGALIPNFFNKKQKK